MGTDERVGIRIFKIEIHHHYQLDLPSTRRVGWHCGPDFSFVGATDMTIGIFIDGNVWNFLFDRKLDLARELPSSEFSIYHTREAEFEIPHNKPDLASFIEATMERCRIQTDIIFGFADDSKPADEQRFGGFGVGRFASPTEIDFISKHQPSSVSRPTKLQKHEADISLAVRSLHAVVLTFDRNSVALKHASARGGKVVYMDEYSGSNLSLGDFIRAKI